MRSDCPMVVVLEWHACVVMSPPPTTFLCSVRRYGFDPHDDSDNLRIHNNVVWNNGDHGIIASKRCNDVSIQNNVVYDNLNAGIMLHRSSDSAIVRNNTISGSGDACIAIFESFGGLLSPSFAPSPALVDLCVHYCMLRAWPCRATRSRKKKKK